MRVEALSGYARTVAMGAHAVLRTDSDGGTLRITILGAAGEAIGIDKYLKTSTVKHRTLSLLNRGLFHYAALPRMKERAEALMARFGELLREHRCLPRGLRPDMRGWLRGVRRESLGTRRAPRSQAHLSPRADASGASFTDRHEHRSAPGCSREGVRRPRRASKATGFEPPTGPSRSIRTERMQSHGTFSEFR